MYYGHPSLPLEHHVAAAMKFLTESHVMTGDMRRDVEGCLQEMGRRGFDLGMENHRSQFQASETDANVTRGWKDRALQAEKQAELLLGRIGALRQELSEARG